MESFEQVAWVRFYDIKLWFDELLFFLGASLDGLDYVVDLKDVLPFAYLQDLERANDPIY